MAPLGGLNPGLIPLIQQVQRDYPSLAYLLGHPEIGPLLLQSASGMDPAEFAWKLYGTNWWKTHSDSMRRWDALEKIDPAMASREISERLVLVSGMQQEIAGVGYNAFQGGPIGPGGVGFEFSRMSLRMGWDERTLRFKIAEQVELTLRANNAQPGGAYGRSIGEVRALARDYMIPMSEEEARTAAYRAITGERTLEALEGTYRNVSRSRFSGNDEIVRIIDDGGTPGDYFQPYRAEIGRQLEIPEDGVDLVNDTRFSNVVNFNDEGKLRPMTISEATIHTRQLPAWQETRRAQEESAQFINRFAETMGERSFTGVGSLE